MTIGGLGGGGTVGWIYVNVLADTSGMKDQIEDEAGKGGAAGGKKAANQFDRNLTSKLQKQSASRAIRKLGQKYGEQFAKEFAEAGKEGTEFTFDATRAKAEISKLAKQYKINFNKVSAEVGDQIASTFSKSLDRIEKESVDAANAVAKEAEKLARQKEREDKARLNRQARAAEAAAESLARRQIRAAEDLANRQVKTAERAAERAEKVKERAAERTAKFEEQLERDRIRRNIKALADFKKQTIRAQGKDGGSLITSIIGDKKQISVVLPKLQRDLDKGLRRVNVGLRNFGRRSGGLGIVATAPIRGIVSATSGLSKVLQSGVENALGGVIKGFDFLSKAPGILGKLGSAGSKAAAGFQRLVVATRGVALAVIAIGAQFVIRSITALAPLVVNLAGIFTLLVSAVGNTAAALVLFVPVLTSLGVAAGVTAFAVKDFASSFSALIKAGLSGDPKDWEAYAKSLKNLGPAAKDAVTAFVPLAKGLKELQADVEQKFFEGLGDSIRRALPAFGQFRDEIVGIAETSGDVFNNLFDGLSQDTTFLNSLQVLFDSTKVIVADLGSAFTDTFAGLTNFFAASAPAAERLSGGIAGIAESFRTWTESEENRQGVLDFFNGAVDVAGKVFTIIGLLGKLLVTVFTESQGPLTENDGLLNRIQGVLERAITWLNENKDSLKTFFANATKFAAEVYRAIRDIVKKFLEWNTPENQEFLRRMVQGFADLAGWVLDAVGFVSDLASKVTSFLTNGPLKAGLDAMTTGFNNLAAAIGWVQRLLGKRVSVPAPLIAVPPALARRPDPITIRPPTLQPPSRPPGIGGLTFSGGARLLQRTGGLIDRPTNAIVGEAGPELIIPLRGQIGDVDPIVREISRSLRDPKANKHTEHVNNSKTINLTQHITPTHADPNNVAASAMNRAIALARM